MEILQASIELFARRGILATTMNELARAIRMTPGALYWHFPAKEDLLLAAMEELHRRFIGEFAEVLTAGRKWPAKKQLEAFVERTRAFLRYHPVHGIFFGMLASDDWGWRTARTMKSAPLRSVSLPLPLNSSEPPTAIDIAVEPGVALRSNEYIPLVAGMTGV